MAKDINKLIEHLQGTCRTIDEMKIDYGWAEDEELTDEEFSAIYNELFECDCCGWWFEICEEADDLICIDCYEDIGEEEPEE